MKEHLKKLNRDVDDLLQRGDYKPKPSRISGIQTTSGTKRKAHNVLGNFLRIFCLLDIFIIVSFFAIRSRSRVRRRSRRTTGGNTRWY